MTEAVKTEIIGLLVRGTFKMTVNERVSPDGNILAGRYVFTIKSTEDGKIKFHALFIIGGHLDKRKKFIVHSSQTIQPSLIRFILFLAATHDFEVWRSDVKQTCLQFSFPLNRNIFLFDPSPWFESASGQCLQLLKRLYILC